MTFFSGDLGITFDRFIFYLSSHFGFCNCVVGRKVLKPTFGIFLAVTLPCIIIQTHVCWFDKIFYTWQMTLFPNDSRIIMVIRRFWYLWLSWGSLWFMSSAVSIVFCLLALEEWRTLNGPCSSFHGSLFDFDSSDTCDMFLGLSTSSRWP